MVSAAESEITKYQNTILQ